MNKNVLTSWIFAAVLTACLAGLAWAMAKFLTPQEANFFRLVNGLWISVGLIFIIRYTIRTQRTSDERLTAHRAEILTLIDHSLKTGEESRKDSVETLLTELGRLAKELAKETLEHNKEVAQTQRDQTKVLEDKLDEVLQSQKRNGHDPV